MFGYCRRAGSRRRDVHGNGLGSTDSWNSGRYGRDRPAALLDPAGQGTAISAVQGGKQNGKSKTCKSK